MGSGGNRDGFEDMCDGGGGVSPTADTEDLPELRRDSSSMSLICIAVKSSAVGCGLASV